MMRLFLAVDVDDETRAQYDEVKRALAGPLAEAAGAPHITWVKAESLHVTLRFLGAADEERLVQLQTALRHFRIAPFTLAWGTVGVFGGVRHPRVLWVAPTAGRDALSEVVTMLNAELASVAGPPERRTFRPHLTLGRVRDPGRGIDWASLCASVTWRPSITRVTRVTLYHSALSPQGATYTAMSSHG